MGKKRVGGSLGPEATRAHSEHRLGLNLAARLLRSGEVHGNLSAIAYMDDEPIYIACVQ